MMLIRLLKRNVFISFNISFLFIVDKNTHLFGHCNIMVFIWVLFKYLTYLAGV